MEETTQAELIPPKTVQYLSRKVKAFSLYITMGRRNVFKRAENGILTCTEAEAAALDAMMKRGRPDLCQNLQKIDDKIDPEAVERQRQIMLARTRKGPSALKGAMHSGSASQEKLRQTDQEAREYAPPGPDALAGEYIGHPQPGDPGFQHPGNALIPPQTPTAPKIGSGLTLGKK